MTEIGSHPAPLATGSFRAAVSANASKLGLAEASRVPDPRSGASEPHRVALLAKALESEIIPRLLLARTSAHASSGSHAARSSDVTEGDVRALAKCAIAGDLPAAIGLISAVRARNVPLDGIYLDLLAPTARYLGELWTADRCDFTAVTIGLCCLQQLVLEHSQAFSPRPGRQHSERRILLAPVPGEQHSFGLLMVGEFFRRQGWEVCSGTGSSARELVATMRKQWFSAVGFSLACDSRLDALAAVIRDIRRSARNPHVGVLVGGRVFAERPELATLVGADATACDGQQAVLQAETLLSVLAQEP